MRHRMHLIARGGKGALYTVCGRIDAARATNVEEDVDCVNCLRVIDPDGIVHPIEIPRRELEREMNTITRDSTR